MSFGVRLCFKKMLSENLKKKGLYEKDLFSNLEDKLPVFHAIPDFKSIRNIYRAYFS